MAAAAVTVGVTWCRVRAGGRQAVAVALGAIGSPALTEVVKPVVGRQIHGSGLCYPSGHVAFATGLSLALAVVASRTRGWSRRRSSWAVPGLALAVAAIVGWAVVALNMHYPTDVIGGAAAAFAVVPSLAVLVEHLAERRTGC